MNQKVGIVGSRRYKQKEKVYRLVDSLSNNCIVVSGGCKGVDTWAVERAKEKSLKTIEFLPDKDKLMKAKHYGEVVQCFYDRNKKIAQEVDILYAFVVEDRKGGTEVTITFTKGFGKKVVIIKEVKKEKK